MLRAWAGGWAATEWPGLVAAIEDFPEPDRESADAPVDLLEPLTERELEVLRIAAEGLSNQAIAEGDLPGTLVYDCYVDEQTARFVFNEAYANEAYADSTAMLKHLERMMAAGIFDRVPELADFDLNVVLGEVSDEVRERLGEIGFDFHRQLAVMVRDG